MPVRIPHNPNVKVGDSINSSSKRGKPFLFQVVSPTGSALYPYLLALHANPERLSQSFAKSKVVTPTYGGFIEFVWPDEFDSLSCTGSTGAFLGPSSGLTSGRDNNVTPYNGRSYTKPDPGRQGTIAWERQEDLLELFRSNGNIFNENGQNW
jgi:hypothetical protein